MFDKVCTHFVLPRDAGSPRRSLSSRGFLISTPSHRRRKFHDITVLSFATISIGVSSVCICVCASPDLFLLDDLPVPNAAAPFDGDPLSRPAAPIPGSEMLVAPSAAAVIASPCSLGRISSMKRRSESVASAGSKSRMSWKLVGRRL